MIITATSKSRHPVIVTPEYFTFPDGQPHVKVDIPFEPQDYIDGNIIIQCSIRNPRELFDLFMVANICQQNCNDVSVYIYWLFGARMDRPIDIKQPSTFDIILRSIYANVRNVFLLDIHNKEVAGNCRHLDGLVKHFVNQAADRFDKNLDYYFPDAGAEKRYANFLGENSNVLVGQKHRDSETGKLSGFSLKSGQKQNDSILIIDDLIDAGGTFLGHLPILRNLGYKKVGLYTTHGLYTKGLDILKDFDMVCSTNSFQFYQDEANQELKLVFHKI